MKEQVLNPYEEAKASLRMSAGLVGIALVSLPTLLLSLSESLDWNFFAGYCAVCGMKTLLDCMRVRRLKKTLCFVNLFTAIPPASGGSRLW